MGQYLNDKKGDLKMGDKKTLNENDIMQVNGGREEHSIPIPEPGTDFWRNWNPGYNSFIDSDDYVSPIA